jgi:ParB/RepB/Spo0J family partition protein
MQDIPLNQIHDNPDQPRHNLNLTDAFLTSIETHGLIQPVILYPNGSGYVTGDGHRRIAGARKAGRKVLHPHEYIIRDKEAPNAKLTARLANAYRRDLNPLEWAEIFRADLAAGEGLTHADVAETYGVSRGKVSQYLNLLRALDPRVEEEIHAGNVSFTHARQFARLSDEDDPERDARLRARQRDFLRRMRDSGWNVPTRRLKAWVTDALKPERAYVERSNQSPRQRPTPQELRRVSQGAKELSRTPSAADLPADLVGKIIEEGDDPLVLHDAEDALSHLRAAETAIQRLYEYDAYEGTTLCREVYDRLDDIRDELRTLKKLLE